MPTLVHELDWPDRVVIGSSSQKATDLMKQVYEPFKAPILVTDINSAELIKHAANSFLSLKISYINAVAAICEASGADVEMVADGIGMDKRIGRNFLNAGLGYGGSCFPKDVKAFIAISKQLGTPFKLLEEVERINESMLNRFLDKIRAKLWVLKDKKIAVWGMAFKPDTDDVRNSVAIELINRLVAEGAQVSCCDPKGAEKAIEWNLVDPKKVRVVGSPLEAIEGAEAVILATEWKEFLNVDFAEAKAKMHTALIFDGRNLYNPETMRELGFEYVSVGR